jgi:hypothetical protein
MVPSRTEEEVGVVTERYQCHASLTSANCKLIREKRDNIKVYFFLNKRAGCGWSMGAEGQYTVRIVGELSKCV